MKKTFQYIFMGITVALIILPFGTSLNELLTRIAEQTTAYKLIQIYIVPYISRIVIGVLSFLPGLEIGSYPYGVIVNGVDVRITWNCLGWQSYLLFFLSIFVGFRGGFTKRSMLIALAFGFAGTFLVNIIRIVFTAALVGWWKGLFVILFHNYFMTFVAIAWLFFFWWFSYGYILDERRKVDVQAQK